MLTKDQIEILMCEYCKEIGSDDITGLHICDHFKKWMADKLMSVYYS